MGLLSTVTAALGVNKPTPSAGVTDLASPWRDDDQLTRLTIENLFGTETLPLGRSEALSVSAIARARNLITQQIARFPLKVTKNGQPVDQQPAWVGQLEAARPLSQSMIWIVDSLFFYGRAYLEITERYSNGYPARFAWVPEWLAHADANGMLLSIGTRNVSSSEWIRIDGPHEGILKTARGDIRDAIDLKRASTRAYRNPVPSINLQQTGGADLTEKQIDDLIARWARAREGRNGGVAFTNPRVKAEAMGQQPQQLMIDARAQSALDLSRACNLPAWAIDVSVEGSGMNYTNVPARSRELIDYTLSPYMDAIEGRLSMPDVLPAGQECVAITSALLAGDFMARMQGYQTAISAGIYTPDECRLIEAGQPVPLNTGEQQNASATQSAS